MKNDKIDEGSPSISPAVGSSSVSPGIGLSVSPGIWLSASPGMGSSVSPGIGLSGSPAVSPSVSPRIDSSGTFSSVKDLSGIQYFLLRNLYSIFNFLKHDEASTHASLVLSDDSLEMKAIYLDMAFDELAGKMAKEPDIEWLKKIDNYMQIGYGDDFKKWQYYEVFKSIYLNKFSWKEKKCLVYDFLLNRSQLHGLFSDFLREFEDQYKAGSIKTHIRWILTEKHNYNFLVSFYHIIKARGYSEKVLIVCKFKGSEVTFYIDPEMNGACVGFFKEGIGKRMFDSDRTLAGIMAVNFYKKIYSDAIKSLDIDLIGYDFK